MSPAPPPLPVVPEYFRVDPRRLTWLECSRIVSSSGKVLTLWLGKLTGQIQGGVGGLPAPRPLAENLIGEGEISPSVAKPLHAMRQSCEALGFGQPLYHHLKDSLISTDSAGCLLREPSGEVLASMISTHSQTGLVKMKPVRGSFLSQLADDRLLVTSNAAALFNQPPGNDITRRVGAPMDALLALHRRRLEKHRARGNPPVPVHTLGEMAALSERETRRAYEFNLARGVYVPMTPEEVTRAMRRRETGDRAAALAANPEEGEEVRAVLAVLDRQDHPAASSASGVGVVVLLGISLLLFMAAARLRWDAGFVAMIVGVLLFHEGGHYVAMRVFGYRNLRMFFIPFFGAAVSGLNPHAAGWQKAVVALAGPLPGLILAAGVLMGERWLPPGMRLSPGSHVAVRVAVVALGVNGFNLLPLLPLDGGRFLHETLFSRQTWLRAGFAGAAGLGLAALAWHFGSPLLGVLGFFMLASVGRTLRVGRVAQRLQDRGLIVAGPASTLDRENDVAVQADAVPQVVAALKENRQPPPARAILAAEGVAVINQLRARPPGAGVAAGLLAVYVIAWGLALVPMWPLLSGHHARRHVPMKEDWAHPRVVHPTPGNARAEPVPDK